MRKLWRNWLIVFFLIFTGMGLFIGLFHSTVFFDRIFGDMINRLFWGNDHLPGEVIRQMNFMHGEMGTIMASLGILLLFTALKAFDKKEKWLRNANFAAAMVWFCLDQIGSVSVGFWFNVVFNCVFLVGWMLPYWVNWKKFD